MKIYIEYNFNEEEISYINQMIKPMALGIKDENE